MSRPRFFQVEKAVSEMMELMSTRHDARFYQLLAAMQSGKTQFIIEMYHKFKEKFPNAMGLYIVGHNHKDFVEQNFNRLGYLENQDHYCLTLRERRQSRIKGRPLKSYINDPIIIFYDENHFAEKIEQTIDRFLKANGLYPNKNVYIVGVSATPFSSIKLAEDTTIMYDPALMPTYKSVSMMLQRGDVYEATPILKKVKDKLFIIEDSPAFIEMENIITNQDHGYIIVRIPKKEDADFFMKELNRRFPRKVYVRPWNQHKPISSPSDFFNTYRANNVTVVIVQQKARMGNTIPTQFVHMVYDYSPNASVATLSQGLLGRCCGHGKINDHVKVFTHIKQATAYSLFENGLFDAFYSYVHAENLKTSERSSVEVVAGTTFVAEVLESNSLDRDDIKNEVKTHLEQKFGKMPVFDEKMIVHRLSMNKVDKEGNWYKNIIDNPLDDVGRKKLNRHPRNVSILVDDRKMPCRLFAAFRYNSGPCVRDLLPRPTSIFSQMDVS